MPSQKRVDRVCKTGLLDLRNHGADFGDENVLVVRLGRHGMRAEETRDHVDLALAAESAGGAQRLGLGHEVETIAGLDLDRGDAFGDQGIEPRQRLRDKLILARRARRLHGRDDAAAGARDLLVACAFEPQFEFMRAVAAIDEMSVAIDQSRRDPAAVEPYRLAGLPTVGKFPFGPDEGDPAVFRGHRAR